MTALAGVESACDAVSHPRVDVLPFPSMGGAVRCESVGGVPSGPQPKVSQGNPARQTLAANRRTTDAAACLLATWQSGVNFMDHLDPDSNIESTGAASCIGLRHAKRCFF